MDFKTLTPVLEKGWGPVLHGAIDTGVRTGEILGLAMILPYLNDTQKVKRVFLFSTTLIVIFFLLITISVQTTMGVELAKNQEFPFYSAVKLIDIGNFIERIESIHMGVWLLGGFIKVTFFFYLSVLGLSQLFNLKDYTPIVLPTGLLLIPFTVLSFDSSVEMGEFTSFKILTPYATFFILIVPSILLLISMIRKKGASKV